MDKKGSAVVSAAIWVTLYDGRSDIFSFGTFFVGNFGCAGRTFSVRILLWRWPDQICSNANGEAQRKT